ncbi:MAG: hypothetical protein IT427_17650 [Pirellulales bacterium]|nr:hypothetical protein [Pirellulales bacterium]
MRIRSILLTFQLLGAPAAAWAVDAASVTVECKAPPILFAAEEIRTALKQAHWTVGEGKSQARVAIKLQEPDGRGDEESFEILTDNTGGVVNVHIRGKDVRGVMYGGLDVAEQIAMSQGSVKLAPRQGKPFLPVRGLKFNIPLAGNDYLSQEDLDKGDWFWDLDYWQSFMRFLAYHRYNLLSFWNSHPYDQMVRLEKYPEANRLSKEQLDRNIAFFHKLFGMARDYGLDTSVVTWNIHMSPTFQEAHKIKGGEDTPLVRDYQRECVRALLKEYPELTGMGTCPGERMGGVTTESREEWIRQTYLQGIADAERSNAPFILRYWGGTPPTTAKMLEKAKYPGPMYLDIKFNGEQMYSSTKVHLKDTGWLTQNPKHYKLLWHLRNDCIYQLRWCDPAFASAVIRNCGGPDSAGFVMGSEIEVPGIDRNHTASAAGHKAWKYEFEKNWTRFGLWGRAGYNPDEPADYWVARLNERFGPQAGPAVFNALVAASKVIPLTTSFHWNYMNGDWYPEGNVGVWNTSAEMPIHNFRDNKLWHDVLEWTFTQVIDDSLQCIPDYVADQLTNARAGDKVITPPRYAQMLEEFADASAKSRTAAGRAIAGNNSEWECTELDLKVLELLGRYYAAKSRAATEVMFFLATGEEPRRAAAIDHLHRALVLWKQLAQVADAHYAAHEIWLFGKQFDWSRYIPEAERDIVMVRTLVPWPRSDQEWKVGGKTVLLSTWRSEPPLPSGLKPWVQKFNNQVMINVSGAGVSQTSREAANTNLVFTDAGTGIIELNSNAVESAKINGQPARVVGAAPTQSMVGPVRMGTNRLELIFADKIAPPSITSTTVIPQNAQFLEAESGKVTAPFETAPLMVNSCDTIVRIPKGKGRGESNDRKIVDNGRITYEVDLPADGNYVVHMAAFWPDTSANSFYYAWDSAAPRVLGNDETFQKWHWVATVPENLKAGKHALTIRNRDEGAAFDCLLVAPAKTAPTVDQ